MKAIRNGPAVENAIETGTEAAAEAVSAMPPGQKAWGQKEYTIAETAARAAAAYMLRFLK